RRHRLPELLEQIVGEFSDYARQLETASNIRVSSALGLITLVAVPLTLALSGDPVLTVGGSLRLLYVVIFGLLIAGGLLLHPAARELLQPLRRPRRKRRPRPG
ncbi:MAG: hypothetical protein ACLPVY_10955, partial [Acidimicrobiia bacterium]